MQPNNVQRKIICCMVAIMIGMLLFPPFHSVMRGGGEKNLGYAWLFSPPSIWATVNTTLLMVQWLGVVIAGTLLAYAAKTPKESQTNNALCTHDAGAIATDSTARDEKTPVGVGGLLSFFIYGNIIGGGLLLGWAYHYISDIERGAPELASAASWVFYKNLSLSIVLIASIYIWIAAYRLLRSRRANVPQKTIVSIWGVFLGSILLTICMVSAIGTGASETGGGIKAKDITDLFSGIIYSIFWTIYFIKSRRVNNTYKDTPGRYGAWHELLIVSVIVSALCYFSTTELSARFTNAPSSSVRKNAPAANYFDQFQNKKGNFFDQFDEPQPQGGNIFDQFDKPQPKKREDAKTRH